MLTYSDEAHKISERDGRCAFYYKVVQMAVQDKAKKAHVFFASPSIANPDVFFRVIPEWEHEHDFSIATQYGVGTVIGQDINKITVQFTDVQKTFILDKKFLARPRFEDDEAIVDAFTVYGRAQEQIKRLQRELELLQK